jgi:hypothetical protein
MSLSHKSEYGATFAIADGDQTVAALLAAAGIDIYGGAKSLEVRLESGGPMAYSVGKVMTALTDGKQLSAGDSAEERSVRFDQVDLGDIHLYGSATSVAYIEVRTF